MATQTVHFRIGDRFGVLLMEIAQEHLTERNNPIQALKTITDSLHGCSTELALRILKGEIVLSVDEEEQCVLPTKRIPELHDKIFPKVDPLFWIERHTRDIEIHADALIDGFKSLQYKIKNIVMKRLIIILLFCLSTLIAYNQDLKPKTLTTIGYSFSNELSVSIGGTYIKNVYVGLDHYRNLNTKLQSNYLNIGVHNDKAFVFVKYGVKTLPYDHSHISKMDYGVEYLWMFDQKWCYGLAFTKQSGIQFKLGLTL